MKGVCEADGEWKTGSSFSIRTTQVNAPPIFPREETFHSSRSFKHLTNKNGHFDLFI